MKLLCLVSLFISLNLKAENFAFYYGNNFEDKKMKIFDYIVVVPENINQDLLKKNYQKFYAYLSICETQDNINKNLIIGENKIWGSKIGDLRKKDYRNFIIKKAKEYTDRGFNNFFLDTVDSYIGVLKTQKEKAEYEDAIIETVKEIKNLIPYGKIIINRGFEIMDRLKPYTDYIVAESMYFGYNEDKKYIKMKEEDTIWLREKLNKAKELGYKVIVIDYLPEENYKERVEHARKIRGDGFIPYISNIELNSWGDNDFEKIKRKILIYYDSTKVSDLIYSQAHRLVQMPLEYYGYVADIKDINKGLIQNTEDYHAVIFCLENDIVKKPKEVLNWIEREIKKGKKILFLGYIPFPKEDYYFKKLKIKLEKNMALPTEKVKIIETKYKSFELPFNYFYSDYVLVPLNSKPVVVFENSKAQKHFQAAITEWGGYIINEAWVNLIKGTELFILNPFEIFKEILELEKIPVLDPTTENGRRILFAHIDGDGFNSRYEPDTRYYASEILKKEILEKYTIPHSVSIIRGDFDRKDLDKNTKEKLIKIAREIFSLDNVEIANHSYSHPFKWIDLKNENEYEHIEQVYNINIPDYNFNIREETINTNKWIDENLAPKDKKTKLFFWTGDCVAPYSALKLLYDNNILNINGGYTVINKEAPFTSFIHPFGLNRDGFYQIYTGQQNENVYTNLWTEPFWGYQKVIETFEMTEKPRRLKPINIYYHFYSASKWSSLKALKKVYDYAINQKTNPQFASDYIKKVLDFYEYEIYKNENKYIIVSNSESKTIRIDKSLYPEISLSVCGYDSENDLNYIHLYGKSPYKIVFSNLKSNDVYLKNSNATIKDFKKENEEIYIKFEGYISIEYELNGKERCVLNERNYRENKKYIKEIYGRCKK